LSRVLIGHGRREPVTKIEKTPNLRLLRVADVDPTHDP